MLNSTVVEFTFKGNRTYIQGPDLFNVMLAGFPDGLRRQIRFSAHDFVHTPNCMSHLTTDKSELAGLSDIKARCQCELDGVDYWMALTALQTDSADGKRMPYDEERVTSQCRIEGHGIGLIGESPFSFIETLVSMNKYLHQQLFSDAVGKWIFTRIDLDQEYDAQSGLALLLKHNLNYRLTKSEILLDGKRLGDIYFSLVAA